MDACQSVMFMYAADQWERSRGGVAFFWRKEAKQCFLLLNRAACRKPREAAVENCPCRRGRRAAHRLHSSNRDNLDKCIELQQFALKSIESWFSSFSLHSPCPSMDSRYILEKPLAGTRVGGPDFSCRAGRSVLHDTRVHTVEKSGPVLYKHAMDGGCAALKSEKVSPKGNGLSPGGRVLHDMDKVSVFWCRRVGAHRSVCR